MVAGDLVGPVTAGVCILLLLAIYHAWKHGAERRALVLVVCFGALLRIYFGTDLFLRPWDERFHALVARNFLSHPLVPTLYDVPVLPTDDRDWTTSHIWLHKPPLALWLAASGLALFGINELALRVPALVVSIVSILVTYRIGLWVFGPTTALLAALFQAGNGLLVLLAAGIITSDHVDNLFVFLTQLTVLIVLAWARRPRRSLMVVLGVTIGAAILTKLWAALFVVPIFLFVAYGRRPWRSLAVDVGFIALATAAITAPWFLYVQMTFPDQAAWESRAALEHLYVRVEATRTEWFYYLLRVPRSFGELVYLPIGWFLVRAVRGRCSREQAAVALWIVIPIAAFSLAVSKSIAYIAIAAPAIFLAQADFLTRFNWQPATRSGQILRAVLVGVLLILPFRFTAERLNPTTPRVRRVPWAEGLRALAPQLPPAAVLFGTSHPIEAMFLTGRTAYELPPTTDQITALTARGHLIVVCTTSRVPPEISRHPDVRLVSCGE